MNSLNIDGIFFSGALVNSLFHNVNLYASSISPTLTFRAYILIILLITTISTKQ